MSASDQLWLLRINDTIYGPFNKDKVIDLITKGRVTEIDEALLPKGMWVYLRDCQDFMGALELQKKIQSRKSSTDSVSATETEALGSQESERTSEVTDHALTKTSPIPKINNEDLKAQKNPRNNAHLNRNEFGNTSGDNKSKNKKTIAFVLIAVVVILGSLFFFYRQNNPTSFFDILKNEFLTGFENSWQTGDYPKAFKNIQSKDSLIDDFPLKYIHLLLINERDSTKARLLLKKVNDKSTVDWKLLSGLTYLYEGNLEQAESDLKAASDSGSPKNIEILYNLAALNYLKKDWSQSQAYFEAVFTQDKENNFPSAGYYLSEVWIQRAIREGTLKEQSNEIYSFINSLYSPSQPFSYNLFFMANWLSEKYPQKGLNINAMKTSFLLKDPEVLFSNWQSPYVYRFEPEIIEKYCPYKNNFTASNFIDSSCKLSSTRAQEPPPSWNSMSDFNSDELALISFWLDKRDSVVKAGDVLVKSLEMDDHKTPLKFYVQARFCQKNGNYKCAADNWMKALSLQPNAPTALVGLSLSYLAVGDEDRALNFYEKAKPFAKHLIDFKVLQNKVSNL